MFRRNKSSVKKQLLFTFNGLTFSGNVKVKGKDHKVDGTITIDPTNWVKSIATTVAKKVIKDFDKIIDKLKEVKEWLKSSKGKITELQNEEKSSENFEKDLKKIEDKKTKRTPEVFI